MVLKVLQSGSIGNCYILENDEEALIIEAGAPLREVKVALGFNIRKIVGVVISHGHLDHSRYVKDFIRAGIPVFSAFQTKEAIEISMEESTVAVEPLERFRIGNFAVTPFNVPHDTDIECYGYLIKHEEMGKLLFATDLEYCKYNFQKQKLNHVLVEANYSTEFIDTENPNYEHVLRGHMSLQTALGFISTNDNPALQNVVLIHLSNKNADSALFQQKTKEVIEYGANVYVAKRGLEIELNLCPF